MRSARLVIGVLVAGLVGVVGWHSVWTRTGDFRQTGQPPSEQQSTLQRVGLSPAPDPQQVGPPLARAQKGETEKQLGPFSIAGRNYLVVLRERKVQPGAAGETGGARDGKSRHFRIFSIVSGEWISARIRMRPRQRGHSSTSKTHTRFISSAHV